MRHLLLFSIAFAIITATGCDSTKDRSSVASSDSEPEIANAAPADPDALRILAWNVESEGNFPAVIASQLSNEFAGYDIYALSEVLPTSFEQYEKAVGSEYISIPSTTGESDSLQFLVNGDRLDIVRVEELNEHDGVRLNDGRHRAPLVAHLRDQKSGKDFQITVNHLARGNADFREEQASGLREWARDQTIPTIAVGDFNFDYSFETKQGNAGFAAMLRDNVWKWVEPDELIDTNWDGVGSPSVDRYPDSMLDFAFVAGPAREWQPRCRVIVLPGDFPDDADTSDHRPIELLLTP